MCLVVSQIGRFEPRIVEAQIGVPELQFRFFDCLRIAKRQQQLQAITMIGVAGSFFTKRGEKTILEELQKEISEIGKFTEDEAMSTNTAITSQEKIQHAMKVQEMFLAAKREGKKGTAI